VRTCVFGENHLRGALDRTFQKFSGRSGAKSEVCSDDLTTKFLSIILFEALASVFELMTHWRDERTERRLLQKAGLQGYFEAFLSRFRSIIGTVSTAMLRLHYIFRLLQQRVHIRRPRLNNQAGMTFLKCSNFEQDSRDSFSGICSFSRSMAEIGLSIISRPNKPSHSPIIVS
jgi:hypothetical protein